MNINGQSMQFVKQTVVHQQTGPKDITKEIELGAVRWLVDKKIEKIEAIVPIAPIESLKTEVQTLSTVVSS